MDLSTIALLLVHFLGHSDFVTRERATTELRRLGPVALPALEYGCRHEDPEIAHRAGLLRRELWLAEIERLPMPWIDCLPETMEWVSWPEEGGTRRFNKAAFEGYYLYVASRAGHKSTGPDWPMFFEATRTMCRDLITNGEPLPNVLATLDVMWQKHLRWNTATGRYDLPPPEQIGAPKAEK